MDPDTRPGTRTVSDPAATARAALPTIERLVEQGALAEAEAAMTPFLAQAASDFWVGRMYARCAAGSAEALERWRTQAARFADEPQSAVDLARALRDLGGSQAAADDVLAAAARRFPGDLWVLDNLAIAAEQRGDSGTAAATWRDLLAHHPAHHRAQLGLVRCLLRLGRLDEAGNVADAVLAPVPESAPLRGILAGVSETRRDWPAAARRWHSVRTADPARADGWIGEARALAHLEAWDERDAVLGGALSQFPDSVPIATEATDSALRRRDWPEAIRRARLLESLAPDAIETARALAAALLGGRDGAAALTVLRAARSRQPEDSGFACQEIEALGQCGRWQAALEAGVAAYNRFRELPEPGRGLVAALQALGRPEQAETVLRDMQARFPAERWITVALARALMQRGAWVAAVTLWREAGPPAADEIADHARALAGAGEPDAALAMLSGASGDLAPARIALLLDLGRTEEALSVWRTATAEGQSMAPALLAVAPDLAAALDDAAAAPVLAVLLNEPDQERADWRPVLGSAMARTDAVAARLRSRVADLLSGPAAPANGLAAACARNLCLPPPDPDHIAGRMARALRDGRAGIAALLLGQTDPGPHASGLRIAMRLLLNRNFASPDRLASLTPERLVLLLNLARGCDEDSLTYLCDTLRPLFQAAAVPDLPTPGHVIGAIAHSPVAAPLPGRIVRRLRVAVCLHGLWAEVVDRAGLLAALGLGAHDVTVFAHLWAGRPRAAVSDAALLDRLPDLLRDAMAATGLDQAMAVARTLYPRLLEPDAGGSAPLPWDTAHAVIEDGAAAGVASRTPGWRARCKVLMAHRLAVAASQNQPAFDLFVHLRADDPVALVAPDWAAMAAACAQGLLVFADQGYHLRPLDGLSVGTSIMIGGAGAMAIASDSFALGEMVASGRAEIWGFPVVPSEAGTLAQALHLHSVRVVDVQVTKLPPAAVTLAPLTPAMALARLWADLRARPAVPQDGRLLKAATAEVSGGLAI